MFHNLVRRISKTFRRNLNPTRIVALSFGLIILIGALLLLLPFASKSGGSADLMTTFFTATSATCVTGLVLVDTWQNWTVFGQAVILCMIQLGGLGFMTVITLVSFIMHRRIGLSERLIMVSTLNLNDLDGVVRMVQHVLIGTFVFESAGAVLLSIRFIPRFGIAGGIWRGIFHSVSAFCNAGFDIMGIEGPYSSLLHYTRDPVVLITIMCLVVIGGLGFFVWEDIYRTRKFKKFSLYTKMVLVITGILIVGGACFFFFVEYQNPDTLAKMGIGEKVLSSFFQSVTARTAGFNTINQAGLTDGSLVLTTILMIIGGSSGSTAGGIKTVTAGVLFLVVWAGIKGRDTVTVRGRSIGQQQVLSAITLSLTVVLVFLLSSVLITVVEKVPYLSAAFEVASAMGTVGLSTGITPGLSVFSRLIVILLMYTGRVGMLSFSIAYLVRNRYRNKIQYPTFNIIVG